MLNYDPVTGAFINDNSIYTVGKCGPKWYLMKRGCIGYSRKYHKNVYGNRIMGTFDHYEHAIQAQSYLIHSGTITSSTTWNTTYITRFENQITCNPYMTTATVFPVVTTTLPRVLPVVPGEATIG